MSPIDALERGLASFETKRCSRRLVNDSIFADRKLIGNNWRGHYSITSSARPRSEIGTVRPRVLAVLRPSSDGNARRLTDSPLRLGASHYHTLDRKSTRLNSSHLGI